MAGSFTIAPEPGPQILHELCCDSIHVVCHRLPAGAMHGALSTAQSYQQPLSGACVCCVMMPKPMPTVRPMDNMQFSLLGTPVQAAVAVQMSRDIHNLAFSLKTDSCSNVWWCIRMLAPFIRNQSLPDARHGLPHPRIGVVLVAEQAGYEGRHVRLQLLPSHLGDGRKPAHIRIRVLPWLSNYEQHEQRYQQHAFQ